MLSEEAGILEDHRRELAYFEKSDLNLPAEYGTVTVSSNIGRYFPEIDLKKSRICMKPNSLSILTN